MKLPAGATQRAQSIELSQQKDQNADKTRNDPSIVHVNSLEAGDVIRIRLNKGNLCNAKFPNQQRAIVLWDSGASLSLISESVIRNNPYLRSLPITATEKIYKFTVGGGGHIYSDQKITFSIYIQSNLFEITACIIQHWGSGYSD